MLVGTNQLDLTFEPEALLGNDSFGALEVQLIDASSKARSVWVPLPGTFVRAPTVVKIECPTLHGDSCRLIGTELGTIDEIVGASGDRVKAPFQPCSVPDPQSACIVIPHYKHYVVRSIDGPTDILLDDDLIRPEPAASPSA